MAASDLKNEAAWIKGAKTRIVVGPAEVPTPGNGELLVRVEALAFHPLDTKLQLLDFFQLTYPAIFGASFGGAVVATGADVDADTFKPGDRILGTNPIYWAKDNKYGTFQRYVVAIARNALKLDESAGYDLLTAVTVPTQGSVAALALGVAAKLSHRPSSNPTKNKETVLIWGAGSAVGGYAVQYAAQAGYTVVVTASTSTAGEEDRVKSLGASHVVNYRDEDQTVIENLKKFAPYSVILDCVGQPPTLSLETRLLQATRPAKEKRIIYSMSPDVQKITPDDVELFYTAYVQLGFDHKANGDFVDFLWRDWFKRGLGPTKAIVPQKAHVIRGGLERVQECLDLVLKTKSAQVVLDLQ